MIILCVAFLCLALAAIPWGMIARNLGLFLPACNQEPFLTAAKEIPVSVLIPARNEEGSIAAAIHALQVSTHSCFEVIVMDDDSQDRTAEIVSNAAQIDPRIQLRKSAPLPQGWNGKQHACWQLSLAAAHDRLLFLDADVRLSPDAITRIVAEQEQRQAPLVSGFPYQETGTFAEKNLIPMMHYVLLGYLPIERMRSTVDPGFAAGCGQLFLAKKQEYLQSDGHRAIASSRHDGIKLPRNFRNHGFKTDLFDASDIAKCRMYQSLSQVHRGLLKNATEGIANPKLILPFSILLLGGATIPPLLLAWQFLLPTSILVISLFALATGLNWFARFRLQRRFGQSFLGFILHPLAVLWFVTLQWVALVKAWLKLPTAWRGRT